MKRVDEIDQRIGALIDALAVEFVKNRSSDFKAERVAEDVSAFIATLEEKLTASHESPTATALAEAIAAAGFRMSDDTNGKPTLWCKECNRDSGWHAPGCKVRRGMGGL